MSFQTDSEESWLAQERAAAEKVEGNFFYPAALQVHCCVKSSHRLIVELTRQFLQGCLDLRKSLEGAPPARVCNSGKSRGRTGAR